MKSMKWIIPVVLLLVGWRLFALYGKWAAPGHAAVNPKVRTVDEPVQYTGPIADPDSNVILAHGNRGLMLVRFSKEKGFWGEEPNVINDAAGPVIQANGVIVTTALQPVPSLLSYDLMASRPYAPTGVIDLEYNFGSMAFQPRTGRLFVTHGYQIDVFRAGQKSVALDGSMKVPLQLDPIFSSPDERYLYACEMNSNCYVLDVTDQVGTPRESAPQPLTIDTPLLKLAFTRDGKWAVSIDHNIEDDTKTRISVYRVKETGELQRMPGSPVLAKHRSVSLALSPNGNAMYLGYAPGRNSTDHERGLDIYSLDRAGKIAPLSTLRDGPQAMYFGRAPGRAFGQVDSGVVIAYDVDEQTGSLTEIRRSNPYGGISFVLSSEKEYPTRRGLE